MLSWIINVFIDVALQGYLDTNVPILHLDLDTRIQEELSDPIGLYLPKVIPELEQALLPLLPYIDGR